MHSASSDLSDVGADRPFAGMAFDKMRRPGTQRSLNTLELKTSRGRSARPARPCADCGVDPTLINSLRNIIRRASYRPHGHSPPPSSRSSCSLDSGMNGTNYPIDASLIFASPPEKSETLYDQIDPDNRFED